MKTIFHKKAGEPIGRDIRDVAGTNYPYEAVCNRIWEMACFFCCCSWIFTFIDLCYSNITSQNRVFGARQRAHPGVDHLTSVYIASSLNKQDDYKLFIRRYFDYSKLEKGTLEDRARAANAILDQLYKDKVSRKYSADSGKNILVWTSLLLGTIVTIIEFMRNIIKDSNQKKSFFAIVSYIQGGLGLLALVTTQITNKHIQINLKAASCLHELHTWAKVHFKEQQHINKYRLFNNQNEKSIKDLTIKSILLQMQYQVLDIKSPEDLFESIATLRLLLGAHETAIKIEENLTIYRSRHRGINLYGNEPNLNLRKQNNPSDTSINHTLTLSELTKFTDLHDIACMYNCPIILISEEDLSESTLGEHGIYCQIINEKSEKFSNRPINYLIWNNASKPHISNYFSATRKNIPSTESDTSKNNSQQNTRTNSTPIDIELGSSLSNDFKENTKEIEQPYFIIYSVQSNIYQPVIAPNGLSFSDIRRQLAVFESMNHDYKDQSTVSLYNRI